jgi:hypothetical protein
LKLYYLRVQRHPERLVVVQPLLDLLPVEEQRVQEALLVRQKDLVEQEVESQGKLVEVLVQELEEEERQTKHSGRYSDQPKVVAASVAVRQEHSKSPL